MSQPIIFITIPKMIRILFSRTLNTKKIFISLCILFWRMWRWTRNNRCCLRFRISSKIDMFYLWLWIWSLSLSLSLLLSLSLSLDLSRPIRGEAKASRGGHGLEGGGADVDKITSSKQSRSKLGLISVFNLALTQRPNPGFGFRHLGWLHQQCVSYHLVFCPDDANPGARNPVRTYVCS